MTQIAIDVTTKENLEISIDVTNTGSQSGKEIVPLYVSELYAYITPIIKQLKAFQKKNSSR